MRVFRFSRANGLEPLGKFIDEDGSNFWGVEEFTDAAGNRLIAGSDRDFGLQIFKYTGPGAVLAPPPPPPPAAGGRQAQTGVDVQLRPAVAPDLRQPPSGRDDHGSRERGG